MRGAVLWIVVLVGVAAWTAAPASAKISAMSGAYDGRGKPPEVVKPEPVKPKKVNRKKRTRPGAAGSNTGRN